MMKAFIAILAVVGAATADPVLHAKWSSFKSAHGKEYPAHLESARLNAFAENVRVIEEHNAKFARGEVSYELGLNAHSDLTPEEFKEANMGLVINRQHRAEANLANHAMMPAAGYIDWKSRGKVSAVKNQNSCGSCYAFAAVGLIESALMKKRENESDFSEQDVVDCSYMSYRNMVNVGCHGGDVLFTIEDALKRGLASEEDYPYASGRTKVHQTCQKEKTRRNLSHLRLYRVPRSERQLASALNFGPVAITLNGENREFYNYKGGIYNNPECRTDVNHAVLLVGWGKCQKTNQEYWIIKNSWGPTWGEDGYMRLAKGVNRCGIVSEESFYVW